MFFQKKLIIFGSAYFYVFQSPDFVFNQLSFILHILVTFFRDKANLIASFCQTQVRIILTEK